MRKLLIVLLLCASAWATTTVTGNMKNLGTSSVSGGFVRFWLRGCAGNQPRVAGTGIIAPSLGGVFFFDVPADSSGNLAGTLYSNRDVAGTGNGEVECGGSLTATWYGMQAFFAGKGGPEVPVIAKNTGTLDVSNVTPITTNPVIVAPTGDSTYLRLDAGNSPVTGPITFGSAITANSTLSVAGQITSLLSFGTPPFVVASSTPVANLITQYHPLVYSCGVTTTCAGGGQPAQTLMRFAIGSVQLTTGAATVSGINLFTTSFFAFCMDVTGLHPVQCVEATLNSFNIAGTGSDQITYLLIGQ